MKNIFALVLSVVALLGCAAGPVLTGKGEQVRLLRADPPNCRYVGEIAAYSSAGGSTDIKKVDGRILNMSLVDVKNLAAERNGNAVVKVFSALAADIVFDNYAVYRCPT